MRLTKVLLNINQRQSDICTDSSVKHYFVAFTGWNAEWGKVDPVLHVEAGIHEGCLERGFVADILLHFILVCKVSHDQRALGYAVNIVQGRPYDEFDSLGFDCCIDQLLESNPSLD